MSYINVNANLAEIETTQITYKDDNYLISELPEFRICTWGTNQKELEESITICLEEFFRHWSNLKKLDYRLNLLGWEKSSQHKMLRKNPSEDLLPIQIPKNLLLNKDFNTVSTKKSFAFQ